MNGILIIDKPAGITSHDVVAGVRKRLGIRRVGHTGTLDPFATGVMVLLVGNATRLAQFLDKDEKEYIAEIRFGFETDTGDRTGSPKPQGSNAKTPSADELRGALTEFLGEIEQTPPMYSAKKIDGKKLYELARKGEEIERKQISVKIYDLEMMSMQGDTANIRVVCSAGTYVRTFAEDIAKSIGTLAHLSGLRRTRAGRFSIDQSENMEAIARGAALIDANDALSHLAAFVVPEDRVAKTRNGLSTRTDRTDFTDDVFLRMTTTDGEMLAVGVYVAAENAVQPKVVLS